MKLIGIECLELLLSPNRRSYYYGVFQDSPLTPVIRESVPQSHIFTLQRSKKIPFYFNDLELVPHSDFLSHRYAHQSAVFFGFHPNAALSKRLKRQAILPVANDLKQQNRLENKVSFHRFLTRHRLPVPKGWIIHSKRELTSINTFPCVLQEPESYGSFGTFIFRDKNDLKAFIKNKDVSYPLLCRNFVEGLPCGITMLVDKKSCVLSAIRLQASIQGNAGEVLFHGIQWIPSSALSKKQTKMIEQGCVGLAKALQSEKFEGLVNVDFILSDSGIFFIECNPRISGATWHLSMHEKLFHGVSMVDSWFGICQGKKMNHSLHTLPKCDYEGATLDFDVYKNHSKRKSSAPAGIYALQNNKVALLSLNVNLLSRKDNFFILPGAAANEKASSENGTGVLIGNKNFYTWNPDKLGSPIQREKIVDELLAKGRKIVL